MDIHLFFVIHATYARLRKIVIGLAFVNIIIITALLLFIHLAKLSWSWF